MPANNKTESKHTPGPWLLREDLSDCYGWQILGPDGAGWRLPTQGTDTMGSLANARLIAAAPDLLAAAKDADDDYAKRGFHETSGERAMLRAAIAKAEGRSHQADGGDLRRGSVQGVLLREGVRMTFKATLGIIVGYFGVHFLYWAMCGFAVRGL